LTTLHKLSNRDKHREFAHINFSRTIRQDPILQPSLSAIGITEMGMIAGHTYAVLFHEETRKSKLFKER
jgi:hypothetical protein